MNFLNKMKHWFSGDKGILYSLFLGVFFAITGIAPLVVLDDIHIGLKVFLTIWAELGFAFAIAAILGLTIDARQKEEYTKQIAKKQNEIDIQKKQLDNRNLLSYLTNTNVPPKLSRNIETHFNNFEFVRPNNKQRFTLKQVNAKYCEMKIENEYTFENRSNFTKEWKPLFYLDTPANVPDCLRDKSKIIYLKIETKNKYKENWKEIYAGNLTGKKIINTEGLLKEYPALNNIKIEPDEEIRVYLIMVNMRKNEDAEPWQNMMLTEETTVEIKFEESEYEVEARWVHPTLYDVVPEILPSAIKLQTGIPVFPGNGIFINWHRISK